MDIIISNSSNQPIYEQIYTQIRNTIISGQMSEGDALPSIRVLAKDLKISVITTKRAYDELEQEGFIYSVAGKGCFVAERNIELIREANLKKIEALMEEILALGASCSLKSDELIEMFRLMSRTNT